MPKRVLIKDREIKKAATTSQMIGLENPLKASFRVSECVITSVVRAKKDIPPMGRAFPMSPTIKATKMARMFQAFGFIPVGAGENQISNPKAIEMSMGTRLAPLKTTLGAVCEFDISNPIVVKKIRLYGGLNIL